MRQSMYNLYRDTYSNLFDSVATVSDTDPLYCQATLMKMVLSLQAPVLSMPQMFDSMPLLTLARDPSFLKILRTGMISTSLFGDVSSLKEYVESRLRKEDYIFSCLPFLPQGNKPGDLTIATKKILLEKIQNNGKSTETYSKDLEEYEDCLNIFVEGVLMLDSSLKADSSSELENYRHNIQSAKAVPLSQQIKKTISVLENHESFREDPVVKQFSDVVSFILENKRDMNDRTRYYNVLNDSDMEMTEKKKIKELIDVSYNQSMAPLIAGASRMVVREENEYADVLIQKMPEKDFSERVMSKRLERVYREIQEDSILPSQEGKKAITPEKLNDVLETVESRIQESPAAGREEVVNDLYEWYCVFLEDHGLSLEPDKLKRGIYLPEITSENTQKGGKRFRKIEKKNGEAEFAVENIETKKVTVYEGLNLHGDDMKKVAEIIT
jgi:hypothetical protein